MATSPGTTLPTLAPLNENADAGIKYFSGIATYSKSFAAPKGWKAGQPFWIDLGEVSEMAEVSFNGKAASAVWHAPHRVDIGSLMQKGQNRIEVRDRNLWINRKIGDAQPGATKITCNADPTEDKDGKLRPSGLIGPVTVLGQGQ